MPGLVLFAEEKTASGPGRTREPPGGIGAGVAENTGTAFNYFGTGTG